MTLQKTPFNRRILKKRIVILTVVAIAGAALIHLTQDSSPPTLSPSSPQAVEKVWPSPANLESESHQMMLEALSEIVLNTHEENAFFGNKRSRMLRAKLDELAPDAPIATIAQLKTDLGKAELKLGNELETIRLLRQCEKDYLPKIVAGWPKKDAFNLINSLRFNIGIAYMRQAEKNNCCQRNTPESCIMPIQGEGIHTDKTASRNAISYFEAVLKHSEGYSPHRLQALWLLNIAYMTIGDYPHKVPPKYLIQLDKFLPDEPFDSPRFKNSARKLGLDTFSLAGGVVADDFNNDGNLDLLVSSYNTSGQLRLFINQADGTFMERTKEAGLTGILGGLNMVQADFDNDGWLDVLVLRGAWLGSQGCHPNSLLRNDGVSGIAQFTDITYESGLAEINAPTQTASWADYDNDGDLDLYIGNETLPKGTVIPCQLFRNNGDRTFSDQAKIAGVTNERFTKAVVWGDYNGDRYPDIYVSNFEDDNRLYHNNRDGTFTDRAQSLKVTGPQESFPAWFWDYNNDGILDLYVSGYAGDISLLAADALSLPNKGERSRLYRGNVEGGFTDVAPEVGLTRLNAPMGSNFGDLNGDGFQDFYLGTGEPQFRNIMPNLMYLNQGGKKFVDVSRASGLGHLQKGHAIAFADFDNDGDQDIFEQMGGGYLGDKFFDAFFENEAPAKSWVNVRLIGTKSNRSAIGARIRVDIEDRAVYKWVNSGGSFGANPLRQNIGVGDAKKINRLEVYWPTTGETQQWTEVPLNCFLQITEGEDQLQLVSTKEIDL